MSDILAEMFGFGMMDEVGRFDLDDDRFVSTVRVMDGLQPFETAVQHPDYHDGVVIVVEAYDTEEAASLGHSRWVKLLEGDSLPDPLIECLNDEIAVLLDGNSSPTHQRYQESR